MGKHGEMGLEFSSSKPKSADKRPVVELAAGVGAIRSDVRGFARLGLLHRDLARIEHSRVVIDLAKLDWFDGHMASPMRIVALHAEARGNSVTFTRPKGDVETVLRKNGLLPGAIADHHRTTMPVTEFDLQSAVRFSLYAKQHLARKEMPRMSDALRGKFYEGVDELFANSALHSKSPFGVAVGGQFYPKSSRLDFTLTDGGRGIPGCLRASIREQQFTDTSAVQWAMEDYNTTRQGDIPGGLGSKILRDFIGLNKGKLIVVSNGAFWCQDANEVKLFQLSHSFPGTAVLLEVNTADRHSYDLASAPHPRDIW